MTPVMIQRLRAQLADVAEYTAGWRAGKRWAEQTAGLGELLRLEDFRDSGVRDTASHILDRIRGAEPLDSSSWTDDEDVASWWITVAGFDPRHTCTDPDEFFAGWIAGATEAWLSGKSAVLAGGA